MMKRPSRGMRRFNRLFNSPFDRFLRNDWMDLWDGEAVETVPSLNVREDKNNYLIELAAPGLKKDDFEIDVEGSLLTISCDKETESGEEKENFFRREHNYSCFSRSVTLPDNADTAKIEAKYSDGLLNLTIPKKAETVKTTGQKIRVQ